MLRKVVFWIHLVTGITVGSVLFIMAATGSLMAFAPQLEEFSDRKIRQVVFPAAASKVSLNKIVKNAQAQYPGIQLSGIFLRSAAEASTAVQFDRKYLVYVDPYTGQVLGKGSRMHDFMHAVEDIHRKLASGETGKKITGFCNAAFFFLILGGFYLWWPGKTVKFKAGLQGKARDWNWHNTIGFWFLPLMLITVLTGMTMSYEWTAKLLFRLAGSEWAARTQSAAAAAPAQKISYDYELLLSGIEKKVPGWQSASVWLKKPGDPVSVFILEADAERFFMKSQLVLDPATGDTVKWEPFSSQSRGRKARVWARYLHSGEVFGWGHQMLAMFSAFGVLLLVWTGFSMSWFRFINWRRRKHMKTGVAISTQKFNF